MSVFKRYIDLGLRDLLRLGGLSVSRYPRKPLDLRGKIDDPIEARYLVGDKPVLLEVPLELCRGLAPLGFSLGRDTLHPFVVTVRALMENPHLSYDESPLRVYYENFKPTTAAEVLGFKDTTAPSLESLSPLALPEPWESLRPEQTYLLRCRWILQENLAFNVGLDESSGFQHWGPVSAMKGAIEIIRLRQLLEGIRRNGVQRNDGADGDIEGDILVNELTYNLQIRSGQHRAAVLAALGFERIPLRIRLGNPQAFVYRCDAKQWPQVRAGLYTTQQALTVFDRIFDAMPPPCARHAAIAANSLEKIV